MTYPDNQYPAFDKDGLPVPPPAPQNPFAAPAAPAVPPQMMPQYGVPVVPKQMVVAALLAFFLGGWGIHNFYLGYNNRAIIQLIMTAIGLATFWLIIGFLPLMAVGIWAFVEFIMILMGASPFDRDAKGIPLSR